MHTTTAPVAAPVATLLPHHPLRPPPQLRRVRAGDGPLFRRYVEGLCPSAQRMRFHGVVRGCTPGLQALLTACDGGRQVVFVASLPDDGGERLVGEARYVPDADGSAAEFALSVADAWRGTGVAERLMHRLMAAAADDGIHWLYGDVLETNARMLGFTERLGFVHSDGGMTGGHGGVPGCGVVRVERCLQAAPQRGSAGQLAASTTWLRRWLQGHLGGGASQPVAADTAWR